MAKCTLLCWQEIPSLVEASDADGIRKVQLSQRFQELIDMAAMRRKLAGTDAYLMEWNKQPAGERDGSAAEAVEAVANEIESRYEDIKTEAIRLSDEKS